MPAIATVSAIVWVDPRLCPLRIAIGRGRGTVLTCEAAHHHHPCQQEVAQDRMIAGDT